MALRRIKTYLRNRLTEDHISAIAILNIEQETTNFIVANQMKEMIDKFALRNKIRKNLFLFDEYFALFSIIIFN